MGIRERYYKREICWFETSRASKQPGHAGKDTYRT